MCRPSCCNNTRGQGTTGIAAAAVIGTAMIAVKTGPIVARILHDVVEVLTIVTLTALTALALVVAGLPDRPARAVASSPARSTAASPAGIHSGHGRVRASSRTRRIASPAAATAACSGLPATAATRLRPCPECQPARLAG